MGFLFIVIQTFLLVFALGVDSLVCSFSYGVNKIKISFKSMLMINIITTLLLGFGVVIARILGEFLSPTFVGALSFLILAVLGLSKIFEGTIKAIIKKNDGTRHFSFSMFDIGFVLQIFAQYELADKDDSKDLSVKEAVPLAIALGLDGLSVGLAIGLIYTNYALLFGMAFIVGLLCIAGGCYLGTKLSKRIYFDFNIISGLILLVIAIINIL